MEREGQRDKEHVIKEVIKMRDERNAVVGLMCNENSFILFFNSFELVGSDMNMSI